GDRARPRVRGDLGQAVLPEQEGRDRGDHASESDEEGAVSGRHVPQVGEEPRRTSRAERNSGVREIVLRTVELMPTLAHRQHRRTTVLGRRASPALLMAGGRSSRNSPQNSQPYRADSTFLFFFATPEPGSAALFDPQDQSVTLFLRERTTEDALWHGP